MSRDERFIGLGVVVSFLLLCLAHILILPPYEGFDETAHYSYVSTLSDRHEIPHSMETPLDATIENERAGLPRPYATRPPFERNGGITYSEFFNEHPKSDREIAVKRFWSRSGRSVSYVPGEGKNWEGQQPPLYYFLLALPYRMSREWSPGMRLFFLRLLSILIAAGSLYFWFKAASLFESPSSRRNILLGGLAVLYFPSLFYDLARIGNDSLATLLASGVFYFMLSTCVHRQKRIADFIWLSIFLGLGLLTKLYFVAMTFGVMAGILWFWLRHTETDTKTLLPRLAILSCVPLLLSGGWFFLYYQRYQVVIPSGNVYRFMEVGSLLGDELTTFQFLGQMIRAIAACGASFLWGGTWSHIRLPLYGYVCFVPLFILLALGLFSSLRQRKLEKDLWLTSLSLGVPFCLGLLSNMYLKVKLYGIGTGTGGYYLFTIWPVLGVFLSLSLEHKKTWVFRSSILFAFAWVILFELWGEWTLVQTYSGVIQKIGDIKTGVGAIPLTIGNLSMVLARLNGLTFSYWAIILYLIASFLKIFLLAWSIFFLRSTPSRVSL